MFDNNLILLIVIGIVIFLIMNLNKNKTHKKTPRFMKDSKKEYYENFTSSPSSTPMPTPAPAPLVYSSDLLYNQVPTPAPAPSSGPAPAPTPTIDSLNSLYNSNLKGSASTTFNSSSSNTAFTAEYGQGFNLGIDNKDARLSKFFSQAPTQKSPLISDDLLPKKNENWFETPSVGTKIDDANLLADAIFKTGVDTIGSTRKNPSYDMRGNIANPKFPISPWNNSSYEPDNNLKGLCN